MSELLEFGEEQCRDSWNDSTESERMAWLKFLDYVLSSEAQCLWDQLRAQTKAAILEEWLDNSAKTGSEPYLMEAKNDY